MYKWRIARIGRTEHHDSQVLIILELINNVGSQSDIDGNGISRAFASLAKSVHRYRTESGYTSLCIQQRM